ncbi:MAG: sulfite exporter TauE/SafE family protein, partial [Actinomycetes bacterium]
SMVSYPALLAAGLSPVAANVTNTVAITASGVGSALGARPELRGQADLLRRLGLACLAGGLLGGVLLLVTPAEAFENVVPGFIAGASVAVLARPQAHPEAVRGRTGTAAQTGGIFLAAVYGGYFGAAAGVMMLAILSVTTSATLARDIALKNVLLLLANLVAAAFFVVAAPVDWGSAVPLGTGFFVGGRLGPAVVRRAPATPLRLFIALSGLVVAATLAVDTYA